MSMRVRRPSGQPSADGLLGRKGPPSSRDAFLTLPALSWFHFPPSSISYALYLSRKASISAELWVPQYILCDKGAALCAPRRPTLDGFLPVCQSPTPYNLVDNLALTT